MSSVSQSRHTSAEGVEGGPDLSSENDRSGQVEELVSPALLGEAMIERAKTVVIVARRVDDDQAAQILLDAADKARIPVRVAADQVMAALQDSDDQQGGITQDMLVRALDCVRPVERDPGSEQLGEQGEPLTGPSAHQAA